MTPLGAGLAIPALEARGLGVGYRRPARTVLGGLDLAVAAGELVCLIGPNGIGKSTLLRTLARIQPPLAGAVRLGGDPLASLRPRELARRLAIVTTERADAGALPAYRLVALGRYAHQGWGGALSEPDHAAVRRAIRAVGAEALAGRDARDLSDGERQRIAIARALAQEPRVLLLDEPTAYLDLPSRVGLLDLLRRLARTEALAIVVATHDLELALRTADTVWLALPGGRLVAGAPEDLVRAGHLDAAFRGERIRFSPDERAFRLVAESGRRAIVRGVGLGAALAAAVLEREGYAVTFGADPEAERLGGALVVTASPDGARWTADSVPGRPAGTSFAALAGLARRVVAETEAA